jgi:penicillin-binding protein 1B
MVKAPNLYAPTRHPDAALQRRNYILQRMREHGDISSEEYEMALQEPITTRKLPPDVNGAPYFADFVREQLQETYPNDALTTAGLHVFTSLDMRLQRIGQEIVRSGVEELEAHHPHLRRSKPEDRLQACLVAIQPQTGAILAMVGGRDYQASQFNRVTQAHRQPGSVFKPIVYLTALTREREHRDGRFLPTSTIQDEPFTWFWGDQAWSPGNYKDKYYGTVTLRRALEQSLNAATARVAKSVGLKSIRDTAQRLGFVSPLPLYPSLVLGSAEVTPLEVAVAFSTLANQGVRVKPLPIMRIANQEGETLERRALDVEQVILPEDAYMITHMMEGVIERGTGREIRKRGFTLPAAGKTGTTNDYGDAWFVGYTPDLVVVVWVGFDHRESLNLSGGQAALPIWTEFMKRATVGRSAACFVPPSGVRLRRSSYGTGTSSSCPDVADDAFYLDDEPTQADIQSGPRTVPIGATAPSPPSSSEQENPTEVTSHPLSSPSTSLSQPSSERKPWWRLF